MNGNEIEFFSAFLVLIGLLLALDIGVFHKKDHVISIKEAFIWTVVWITIALLFDGFIFCKAEWIHGINTPDQLRAYYDTYCHGSSIHCYNEALGFDENLKLFRNQLGIEYLSGYLMEKSLSIDNIFVMILIFTSFNINKKYYHRVLFWGIIGAIVLRFVFIFVAAALISKFVWILAVFGLILVYEGIKLFFNNEEERIDTENHPMVRFAARFFKVLREPAGHSFFKKYNGTTYITPLFIVLLVIEFSDIIFAVDSIPAVFSITQDPFIVFFSNIFAILGLRSLFFLLDGVVDKFWLLRYGLGVLLTFIGVKMLLDTFFHIEIATAVSLFVILGLLVASISLSLLFPKKAEKSTVNSSEIDK